MFAAARARVQRAHACATDPSRETSAASTFQTWLDLYRWMKDGALLRSFQHFRLWFVQDDARERVDLVLPRRLIECAHGLGVAGLPAHADAGGAEVDVLGVVLVFELRRQQPHDVHDR